MRKTYDRYLVPVILIVCAHFLARKLTVRTALLY